MFTIFMLRNLRKNTLRSGRFLKLETKRFKTSVTNIVLSKTVGGNKSLMNNYDSKSRPKNKRKKLGGVKPQYRRNIYKTYRDIYIYTKNYVNLGFLIDVYITRLNIMISLSKHNVGSMYCFCQGMLWQKYLKKGSQDAASKVGMVFGKKVASRCYYPLILRLRTRINLITEGVMDGLCVSRLFYMFCVYAPAVQHNGCRHKRRRRKKIRVRKRRDFML